PSFRSPRRADPRWARVRPSTNASMSLQAFARGWANDRSASMGGKTEYGANRVLPARFGMLSTRSSPAKTSSGSLRRSRPDEATRPTAPRIAPSGPATSAAAPGVNAAQANGFQRRSPGATQRASSRSASPFASKKPARPAGPEALQWERIAPDNAKPNRRDSNVGGSSASPLRSK